MSKAWGGRTHPWDVPDCPVCEHEIYVDTWRGDGDWVCHRCDEVFADE